MQESHKTYFSKGLARAHMLAHNCALALMLHKDTGDQILPPIQRSKKVEVKPIARTCKYSRCSKEFETTNKKQFYCTRDCRNNANVRNYNKRKKSNPAHYADIRGIKNRAWLDYNTREMMGYPADNGLPIEPPKFPGRPTKVKKAKLQEHVNKLNRIRHKRETGDELARIRKDSRDCSREDT